MDWDETCELSSWRCISCAFQNHGELFACEMCAQVHRPLQILNVVNRENETGVQMPDMSYSSNTAQDARISAEDICLYKLVALVVYHSCESEEV